MHRSASAPLNGSAATGPQGASTISPVRERGGGLGPGLSPLARFACARRRDDEAWQFIVMCRVLQSGLGDAMATNKKKLLITQSMAPAGWALLKERGDIEAVEFPNTISAPDF